MGVIANGLVILGAFVLALALVPAWGVIRQLPEGSVRRRWRTLTALIVFFIVGYSVYAVASWHSHEELSDLLVPALFFFGAVFVSVVNTLSLQAAVDVKRVATLERDSNTDPLMGIRNRRYFDHRIDEEVARALRYDLSLSVLLLDIDHFKSINDDLGHQVGDAVLRNLGRLIVAIVRVPDLVARYGGEEIMIIAPSTSSSEAASLAERLRQTVEATVLADTSVSTGKHEVRATVSIGVSTLSGSVADSRALIESADKALYRAKREGRNRVVVADGISDGTRPLD